MLPCLLLEGVQACFAAHFVDMSVFSKSLANALCLFFSVHGMGGFFWFFYAYTYLLSIEYCHGFPTSFVVFLAKLLLFHIIQQSNDKHKKPQRYFHAEKNAKITCNPKR